MPPAMMQPADAPATDPVRGTNGNMVLLRTKLSPPRAAAATALLERHRLATRLASGFRQRLVLVCAPAGFGKTTLVLQAIAGADPREIAWLSIDERDNDPARFLVYLAAALHGGGLDLPDIAGRSPAALLDRALNDLAAADRPLTLVIDDLHRVDNPTVFKHLAYLIDFMPPAMRLIITSRAEPPLPLARFRAYGDLLELRGADLSFTPEETARFLALDGGEPLDPHLVQRVHERTGGWIFALQTLRALLRNQPPPQRNGTIEGFIGSHRQIADFLLDEILRTRSPEQRSFLLRTSILPRLSGGLCDALTGGEDGAATLAMLEREGIPLDALDEQRRWYRYHHLFAELLTAQLHAEEGPEAVARLHRTAGAYLRAEGLPDEAIEHVLAAGDWPEAVELLREIGYDPVGQRRVATFRRWLESLPASWLEADPLLSYWYGRSLYTMSEPGRARGHLERAERLWTEAGELGAVADVLESRAWSAILDGSHAEAVALAERAAILSRKHPSAGVSSPDAARYTLAVALSRVGRARDALVQMSAIDDGHPLADLAAIERGYILMLLGRFDEARASLGRGLAADNPTKQLLRAHIWLATIELAWNELDRAGDHLGRAADLAITMEAPPAFPSLETMRARWHWIEGRPDSAYRELEREIARAGAAGITPAVHAAEAVRAGFWLEQGRRAEAEAWLRDLRATGADPDTVAGGIVGARLLRHTGDFAAAVALLERQIAAAARDGRVIHAGRATVQLACVCEEQGQREAAARLMERALDLLAPSRHVRAFLDDGAAKFALDPLRRLAGGGRHLEHIARVLDAAGAPGPTGRTAGPDTDPLSPRELEVLRLVAIGLSNRDIADQLFISVPTVKRHLSTVFEKLHVANRTQAVALARTHELL